MEPSAASRIRHRLVTAPGTADRPGRCGHEDVTAR
jgi:hypothetical protein